MKLTIIICQKYDHNNNSIYIYGPPIYPNSNKIVYIDDLYEYKLIAFINYILSLKSTMKINNVKIGCYAGNMPNLKRMYLSC